MSLKRLIKGSLMRCHVLRMMGRALPSSVAILRYHSVRENPEDCVNTIGPDIVHRAADFERHMQLLREQFVPVTLDEIVDAAIAGRRLPRRAVAVTFDDGYRDNYDVAAAILDRYAIKATFYVSVGWIDSHRIPWFCRLRHGMFSTRVRQWDAGPGIGVKPLDTSRERMHAFLSACYRCATLTGDDQENLLQSIETQLEIEDAGDLPRLMMNWQELRELQAKNHIIGSHTVTHPNVAKINDDLVRREMSEAKRLLDDNMGRNIVHFSYPAPCLQPHWTATTIEIARQVGYRTAVTSIPGSAGARHDLLCLPRIDCSRDVQQLRWDIEKSFLLHSA